MRGSMAMRLLGAHWRPTRQLKCMVGHALKALSGSLKCVCGRLTILILCKHNGHTDLALSSDIPFKYCLDPVLHLTFTGCFIR